MTRTTIASPSNSRSTSRPLQRSVKYSPRFIHTHTYIYRLLQDSKRKRTRRLELLSHGLEEEKKSKSARQLSLITKLREAASSTLFPTRICAEHSVKFSAAPTKSQACVFQLLDPARSTHLFSTLGRVVRTSDGSKSSERQHRRNTCMTAIFEESARGGCAHVLLSIEHTKHADVSLQKTVYVDHVIARI